MKNILITITIVACCYSCGITTPKYLFAPNTPNVFCTKKKKDMLVAVNFASTYPGESTADGTLKSNGIDIQTAYAISNSFAIKCDLFAKAELDESNRTEQDEYYYKLNYKRKGIEISGAYNILVGTKKKNSININTGIGIGSDAFSGRYVQETSANRYFNAKQFKWFIMPVLNVQLADNYAIIIAYRVSVLRFNSINTNDKELRTGLFSEIDKQNSVFASSLIDNQFGFNKLKGIKFRIGVGTNLMMNNLNYQNPNNILLRNREQYLYHTKYVTLGTILNLQTMFKKNKQ